MQKEAHAKAHEEVKAVEKKVEDYQAVVHRLNQLDPEAWSTDQLAGL